MRDPSGNRNIYYDLPEALADPDARRPSPAAGGQMTEAGGQTPDVNLPEWRIHFHIPLHTPSGPLFETTNDHLLVVLDLLAENPHLCSHLEMETYTWEVLPPELKSHNVAEQLAEEYEWLLPQLAGRGLSPATM